MRLEIQDSRSEIPIIIFFGGNQKNYPEYNHENILPSL